MTYNSLAGMGYESWERTIRRSLWRSLHFYLALIFNVDVFSGLYGAWHAWSRDLPASGLVVLTVVVAALTLYADQLIFELYRNTKRLVMADGADHSIALTATYLAYRFYLLGVGCMGVGLQIAARYLR